MTSYVGWAAGNNTVTMPTHQAGDLLIAFASNEVVSTVPTLPAGWTSITTSNANSFGTVVAYQVATSSGTASGTWTSATGLLVMVYRPTAGYKLAIGGYGFLANASGISMAYPAISPLLTPVTGSSWVVRMAAHKDTTTALETPPTGYTNRASAIVSAQEIAGHDSNGVVSSAAQSNFITLGGVNTAYIVVSLEVMELPIVLVASSSSTTYASRTNTTVTAPTGIANDDILLAAIFTGRTDSNGGLLTPTPPSGFTLIDSTAVSDLSGDKFNGGFFLYWKRAASESGSYTFTHAAASTQAVIQRITGCLASGSPVDVYSKASAGATGTNPTTATSITTTAANDLLVWLSHDWEGKGTLSPPTGFTERFDSLIYAADVMQATAGASGSKTQTNGNGTSNPWAVFLIGLKAAVSGAGPSAISGSASVVDASDAVGGSGLLSLKASAAITDANDTVSAAGSIKIGGVGSVVDANDTVTGSGLLGLIGSGAITDAGDTVSATGSVKLIGSASVVDANDTAGGSATMTPLPSIVGIGSAVDINDTVSGSGSLKTSGAAAVVDVSDEAVSSGGLSIRGTAAASDANDIASGSGSLQTWGAASVVDAGDTATGSGQASIAGAGSATDADDIVSGSSVRYGRSDGSADLKDIDDPASGSGSVKITATGAVSDVDDIAAGAGAVKVGGQAAIVLSDDISIGSGSVRLLATGFVGFDDDTASGVATLKNSGSHSSVDADDRASGIGFVIKPIIGIAAIVDDDDRASGFGKSRQPVRHKFLAFLAGPHPIEAIARSPVAMIGRIKPPTILVGFLGEEKRRGFDLQKITHLQGDSFLGEVTVRDKDGIVSLSGAIISWRIAEKATDPAPLIEKTTGDGGVEIVDAVNGRINLRLSATEATALQARDYYHQVRVTFPSGEVATVIREYLTIVETL